MDPAAPNSLNLKKICLWWIISLGAILAVGLAISSFAVDHRITRDPAGRLRFDVERPFKLEFYQGGYSIARYMITIHENGRITVLGYSDNLDEPGKELAAYQLTPDQIQSVARSIVHHGLPQLHLKYDNPNVHDGEWWSISIEQGGRVKSADFRNHFPDSIVGFAGDLDALLIAKGYKTLPWGPADQLPAVMTE